MTQTKHVTIRRIGCNLRLACAWARLEASSPPAPTPKQTFEKSCSPPRVEQNLTNTHPGARASCNFYTACRFIHESHAHLPTLDCALAEAGCPQRGDQRPATMTSSRGSKNLPTRPHPPSTRQCKGGAPKPLSTWTKPHPKAPPVLPRPFATKEHSSANQGAMAGGASSALVLASARADGQQRPQS